LFCPALKQAENYVGLARTSALNLDWKNASVHLAEAAREVESLFHRAHWRGGEPLLAEIRGELEKIEHAIALAGGVELKARADRSMVVRGETFQGTASAPCRKEVDCGLGELKLLMPKDMSESKREGDRDKGWQITGGVGDADPPSATERILAASLASATWNQL